VAAAAVGAVGSGGSGGKWLGQVEDWCVAAVGQFVAVGGVLCVVAGSGSSW
jgi:hypothetical protein